MHYVSRLERVAQFKLLGLLIRQRFGALPEVDVRLREATPKQLETWALRILKAERLDEVFARVGWRTRDKGRTITALRAFQQVIWVSISSLQNS